MTDRETALSILTRVAAELVRHDGLPDHRDEKFKRVGRISMFEIRDNMHRRGREIAKAIELLRKDAK